MDNRFIPQTHILWGNRGRLPSEDTEDQRCTAERVEREDGALCAGGEDVAAVELVGCEGWARERGDGEEGRRVRESVDVAEGGESERDGRGGVGGWVVWR